LENIFNGFGLQLRQQVFLHFNTVWAMILTSIISTTASLSATPCNKRWYWRIGCETLAGEIDLVVRRKSCELGKVNALESFPAAFIGPTILQELARRA